MFRYDLSAWRRQSVFQMPQIMHFGIQFDPSSCIAWLVCYLPSMQFRPSVILPHHNRRYMGSSRQIKNWRAAYRWYGCTNVIGAFLKVFRLLPIVRTRRYRYNDKGYQRSCSGMSAGILLIAGLVPEVFRNCWQPFRSVLGGATISVFAFIAMTGIKLITSQPMSYRNTSIVGLSGVLGVGVTQASASLWECIVPYFVLPQFYPIFAYREADAPLLCSYRGGALSQKNHSCASTSWFSGLKLGRIFSCGKSRADGVYKQCNRVWILPLKDY